MDKNISLNLAYDFVNQFKQILPNEQFILLTLIKITGTDYRGFVQMSTPEIAKIMGFHSRTIQHHVAKLKVRNIIDIENTYVGDSLYTGPNKYRIVGWPEWVEKHA